jgi:hypothetical protein
MIVISGILLLAAACIAGALLWSLAVHALPLWCGGLAAVIVHAAGGGIFAALIAGLLAATATLVIGQFLIGFARSPLLRIGVGLAFALPAAIAGYYAASGLSAASGVEDATRVLVAVIAALCTAAAACRGALRPRSQTRSAAPDRA